MTTVTLLPQAGEYAVCRLLPTEAVPPWAGAAGFSSVTRTADELSIICAAALVPANIHAERDWRLLKFQGPFPFTATGILSSVLAPLAAAKVGILALSTFDTDYLLVKAAQYDAALRALDNAGHKVRVGAGAPSPRSAPRTRRLCWPAERVPKRKP